MVLSKYTENTVYEAYEKREGLKQIERKNSFVLGNLKRQVVGRVMT